MTEDIGLACMSADDILLLMLTVARSTDYSDLEFKQRCLDELKRRKPKDATNDRRNQNF